MGDRSVPDEEQHVIVAAHHVVKALAASRNLSTDLRKILADLDSQLTKMTKHTGNEAGETSHGVEDRLNSACETILSWQSNRAMIWDSAPQEASEYLKAVDEVRRLTESLGALLSNRSRKDKELLNQAHNVLHIAMERLQDELVYILSQNVESYEAESTCSFRSCEESQETSAYSESVVSTEDDSIEVASQRVSNGTDSEEYSRDLIHPDVISDVKCIANLMFASNYGQEFCSAFISFWNDTLEEYLRNLGIEKLSTEEVMKMDWRYLSGRIKKWCRAMKIVIRFFLTGQKHLFDQVLGDFGSATSSICFLEASKASILTLLNFGQAIAIGPREPDRLPSLIDMYEALGNNIPDIDALFKETGSFIQVEFGELLSILGDTVKSTFLAFGDRVAFYPSRAPFPNGGVHPLTKYVMNYITLLAEYSDSLNFLLEQNSEPLDHQTVDSEVWQNNPAYRVTPIRRQLCEVTLMLERNLDYKSNLYKDVCLKHIFMMNNMHYMVQKVDSKLRTIFGDQWIRIHNAKFQKHANNYERATWSSVLCLLRVDGDTGKAILKERCRAFSIAFEEVYKSQTGWSVPDLQLREDLRISASQTVIIAYRLFVTRVFSSICDRHIKYSVSDIENYILDLFEGSSRSLPRRR